MFIIKSLCAVTRSVYPGVVPGKPAGGGGAPVLLPGQGLGACGVGLDGEWVDYFFTTELYRQVRYLDEYLSGKGELQLHN